MEEDTEYTKLPLEDRCVHKLWKARVHGYEEAAKLFRQIPDEKAPEWNKFLGLVKKFASDSNAAAQEKGLEALLAYVESAGPAGKTVGEVMSNIVSKCLAAPKTRTKELSVQVVLMYVEIERHEQVMEELLKGFDHKNPKVVSACINVATQALREFGSKVVAVKPLVKEIPKLLDHRDKVVRDEGKALIVEVFRWVGVAVKPQLNSLKPVQLTELEAEFEKVTGGRAVPARYLRSQQERQQQVAEVAGTGDDDGGGEDEEDGAPEVDPYELLEPVDILAKLPKDFYEKLEAKKWQERKEAMDELDKLLQNPKLESGDYADLVRALKKIISKDTNVMIVATAGRSLACLAKGLKKRFQPYAHACLSCVLEKFREKKQNVVVAMREAIDAVTQILTLETMQEDMIEALANKNPAVKAETAAFLSRYFTKCTPQMLDRKMLKAYTPALLKTLNEPDPIVRDNSAEALGTAMKVVGERAIMAYIGDIDNLKVAKIKECCEKAVITAKVPKAARPATAPAKMAPREAEKPAASKPVRRPGASAPPKKPAAKKTAAGKGKAASKKVAAPSNVERELAEEEVEEAAEQLLAPEVLAGLADGNWKTRLSAAEQLLQAINGMEKGDIPAQVLIRTLNKKPGLRDGNFQVLKVKFDVVKCLAENAKFTRTTAQFCLQDVADKLGDPKTGAAACDALVAVAEATRLDFVATEVVVFAFNQKSPRLQQEAMLWLSASLREFGFVVQPKPIIENVRKALSSSNVGVRTAGITLLGTMFLYMRDALRPLVDGEKPSLLQQINAEFEKMEDQEAPPPFRGLTVSTGEDGEEGEGDEEDEDGGPDPNNLQELLPRADLSGLVSEAMLSELADKNWKVRDEALQKVAAAINSKRYVAAALGELPQALAARMQDSNKNIALTAFTICKHLGQALGTQARQHLRVMLPAMLQGLGDSKNQIRVMAMESIKTWSEQCGTKELFEGEMIADALKTGNPFLRAELFLWLSESLPNAKGISKEELVACLPVLLVSVEDRSAEVRKSAQDAILPFMIHVGYEAISRQTAKLPSASRTAVATMLDKARANLPAKPVVSKSKGGQEPKSVMGRGKPAAAAKPAAGASKAKASKPGVAGRGRKEEEVDTSPMLQVNNLKNQRIADEQKFRILKWNFTTPREEFIDLLKEQMTAAGVNKTLMFNMFHSDFKFHLKAIDALNESLNLDPAATMANLDLILKWLTLRFFDTNPSVLLRGLEFLLAVFVMLAEDGYNMLEVEAASFVPYLILKAGDPKDTVRNSVRAILQQITLVYSCSKLFAYVMEGLKSKNSRQRTECLEELGTLIENYGISVCQPTPAAALKEIARQISDRDNSVRTAALNCVVQAWYQEGDRIYKMIGQISDKDLSLLTERIKRAGKNRPTIRSAPPEPPSRPTKVVRPNTATLDAANGLRDNDRYQEQMEEPEPRFRYFEDEDEAASSSSCYSSSARSSSSRDLGPPPAILNKTWTMDADLPGPSSKSGLVPRGMRPASGKFRLDYNMLEELETDQTLRAPDLVEMDLEELIHADVRLPNVEPSKHMVTSPMSSGNVVASAAELYVGRLCCHQLERSVEACREVEGMLRRESSLRVLVPLTDQLLVAITNQLQLLHKATHETHDMQLMSTNYTLLITILRMLFAMPDVASRASQSVIRDLMSSLLSMLVEQKLERFPTEDQITRLTNSLVVRIIENSEHTKLVTAQLRMLYECIATPSTHPKFTELVMKSLWKVMRVIESWDDSLDFAAVLKEVNHFLADFPSHTWRDRANQVPLKTVKTLVHTMVQMKGAGLLSYLGKDDTCPELSKIINKYIVTCGKTSGDKAQTNGKEGMSPHRFSKLTHEQLSTIFKKIGSKDQTKEGLEQLYEFQKVHPDADIGPFLEKSSQFFQDYIEKGLKSIEKDRVRHGSTTASSLSSPQVVETPSDSGSECPASMRTSVEEGEEEGGLAGEDRAHYYKERLKMLQSKAGLGRPEVPLPPDNRSNDINRNRKAPAEMLETLPRSVSGETVSPPSKGADMEQILQRLERFKR